MPCVVNNNRGFLQLLADCPAYQRQFLLKTASPQQLHALVQVLYNILNEYILLMVLFDLLVSAVRSLGFLML